LIGVLASLLLPVWSDTITYVHTDMMGSPIAETDESGNVLWREHYTPFGEKVDKEAASVNNSIGYTGHVNDNDTGLTYMQARYYDPVIGRFYSNDPIGFRDIHSFNRYAYVRNNPYKYIDPTGMKEDWWFEPKKRHTKAVKKLRKQLEKQGFEVEEEKRVIVVDEDGNRSIRVMDLVTTSATGQLGLLKLKHLKVRRKVS